MSLYLIASGGKRPTRQALASTLRTDVAYHCPSPRCLHTSCVQGVRNLTQRSCSRSLDLPDYGQDISCVLIGRRVVGYCSGPIRLQPFRSSTG
jgi:hypothetical protein